MNTRRRSIALGCASVAALVLASGASALAYLARPDPRWTSVVSIETERPYQDGSELERAWRLPVAAAYRPNFESQRNGSFCGPTTVVNAVRSLGGDADQEHVLEGSSIDTLFGFLPGGITVDEVASLVRLRVPQRRVSVVRDMDRETFRSWMRRSNDPRLRILANFHRGPLFGRGGGHHSPIGGYLEEEDLVFVLDTNHDYGPFLVRTDRLYDAVDTIDSSGSGLERGIVVIEEGAAN